MTNMKLNYLDFDYSEDADGVGTFDAMAGVSPAQMPALHAEITAVLAWAHQHWPNACGAPEDGGEWQYDLQGVQEISTSLVVTFDSAAGQLRMAAGDATLPRTTITLTVSGTAAFCDALREAFGIE